MNEDLKKCLIDVAEVLLTLLLIWAVVSNFLYWDGGAR